MTCKCGHEAIDHSFHPGNALSLDFPHFPCTKCDCKNYDMVPKEAGISSDPYPDLWDRTQRYLKEKHPDLKGIPSREMLIDLLLKEAGF